MQLSSEDIIDRTDMLKQSGLLVVAAAKDAGEAPSKNNRAGPYDNSKNQGAAKGGRQKEFNHFLRFRDSFGHF